jgi:hypothetical protein
VKKLFMVLLLFAGIGALAYFLWLRREEEEPFGATTPLKDAEPRPHASVVGQ